MALLDMLGGALGLGSPTAQAAAMPGQAEREKRFQDQIAGLTQQAGQVQFDSPFRQAQTGLLGQLQGQALGQGPSAAEQMLKGAQQQNVASAMGLAASQRGATPGLGLRNALQASTAANQQMAGQIMPLRMQEQLAAQQQLAGLSGQGRQQDIGYQQALTQLAQQYEMMGLNQAQAIMQAQNQINAQNAKMAGAGIGGLLGGLGAMGGLGGLGGLFASAAGAGGSGGADMTKVAGPGVKMLPFG